jgi:UDP-N-acetyl-D-mannosaminuronate dehydrogenase
MHPTVVIVGLGKVGKPLLEIMKSRYRTFAVDINQLASVSQCDVMPHISI